MTVGRLERGLGWGASRGDGRYSLALCLVGKVPVSVDNSTSELSAAFLETPPPPAEHMLVSLPKLKAGPIRMFAMVYF